MNLERHNQELKHITCLQADRDLVFNDPVRILAMLNDFYKNLYKCKKTSVSCDDTNFTANVTLDKDDNDDLEIPISLSECKEALEELPTNKTPGSDGLSAEFYRAFWPILAKPLYRSLCSAIEKGELSCEQRRGIITLIPKAGKDLKLIKNWRPISVLNVDYKIYAKVLANRLKPVLPSIINRDQLAYIQDRLIGENIRIVKDLIDYCQLFNVEGILMLIDFEKAFDTINWDFLTHVLTSFGFGPNFQNLVRTLYNKTSSTIINNGNATEFFDLQRGIRQGCPVSAYLFVICVELLSVSIRKHHEFMGLNIHDYNYRVLQFADDTVIIAKDARDVEIVLNLLREFGKESGLQINREKTEFFKLGSQNIPIKDSTIFGMKWCDEFRYLGIWFMRKSMDMEFKNFRHRLDNIKNILRLWMQRDLSLKGKITILRTLALAQLIYPLTMLEAPLWATEEANFFFFKFLWGGKPDKVKRSAIVRKIEEGGMKMIDVHAMAMALKAKWVRKIYDNSTFKWCNILSSYFTKLPLDKFLISSIDLESIPVELPAYYRQCIFSFSQLQPLEKDIADSGDVHLIRSQNLWQNRYIKINHKSVFYPHWYSVGITTIGDLLTDNNQLMLSDEIAQKYNTKPPGFLEYLSLRNAIPYKWRAVLKLHPKACVISIKEEPSPCVVVAGIIKNIKHVGNKDLYWELIEQKPSEVIPSEHLWLRTFGVSPDNLRKYYSVPYRYNKETKIQSLQYKILMNIYPCGLRLHQWKIFPDSLCKCCKQVDNLMHHFYECEEMKIFWSSLTKWWNHFCGNCIELDTLSVLLGIVGKQCHKPQLNFILLCAKWLIYRNKYLGKSTFFYEFLVELKSKLLVEEYISKKNKRYNVFHDMWYEIYTSL